MATQKNSGNTTTETGSRQQSEAGSRQQQQQREGGSGGEAQGAMRSDQERQRDVSREGGSQGLQSGGGMQRGMQQQQQGARSGAVSGGRGQQRPYQYGGGPSLLPAFFSQPGLMASAFLSDPYEFATRMTEEMDRVFSNFGVPSSGMGMGGGGASLLGTGAGRGLTTGEEGQRGTRAASWTPQIELFQRENELVVHADLPGLSPDDVNVEIEDGVLAISGERRQQSEHRDRGLYRSERSYGSFYRAIPLPEGVNEEQINASFRDGVLEVTLPLPEQQRQRARRIQIRGGNAGGNAGTNDAGRKAEGATGGRSSESGGRG